MSKEHAYAYEAGYRDGSINYELEHCPACKNVADLQEALDENARLRSELESVGTAAYLYGRGDLLAENAKLRELLQRALTSHDKMCTNRGTCLGCLFFNAEPFAPACPIVSVMRDARELGVEP